MSDDESPSGQRHGSEAEDAQRFEGLLGEHRRYYETLLRSRAWSPGPAYQAGRLLSRLGSLDDLTALLAARHPAGTAVLIYHLPGALVQGASFDQPRLDFAEGLRVAQLNGVLEAERVEVMLVDAGGVRAVAWCPADLQAIERGIHGLRVEFRGLGRDGSQAAPAAPDRMLRRRGGPPGRASGKLVNALLPEPVRAALASVEHLVVVPVGGIGSVPFAALEPWPGTLLVERMSVSVAPGLHTLAVQAEPWVGLFTAPLLVGDPSDTGLPPLAGARAEVSALAERLDCAPLLGSQATVDTVGRRMPQADLLYFATHGQADPDDPLDAGALVLAGGAQLAARTIQDLSLRARLAVLSACETGLGLAHVGGMVGLSRAFHLAGVPRVLMSLWPVGDEAARMLMLDVMQRLETEPPAEALRGAMRAMRDSGRGPADWASFALFGTPR